MPKRYDLHFDGCFDPAKVRRITPYLPEMYAALNEAAPWRKGRWPSRVLCMSDDDIVEGRSRGAGHGYTYTGRGKMEVWLNRYMTWQGYFLVLCHEFLHHAYPDATEDEVNCIHLPRIYERVFGERLDPEWARRHGIGAPMPFGDRSYCR